MATPVIRVFAPAPEPKTRLGRHRPLAPSAAIKVSPLCLGGMNFGDAWKDLMGPCDKQTTFDILDVFYENGGNFIDTFVPPSPFFSPAVVLLKIPPPLEALAANIGPARTTTRTSSQRNGSASGSRRAASGTRWSSQPSTALTGGGRPTTSCDPTLSATTLRVCACR
jgi:hypothetical protein